MIYKNTYTSPLGGITLASDGTKLTGLWFDGQKYYGAGLSERCAVKDLPVFDDAKRWLDLYFQGNDPGFTPEISLKSTPFRTAVWEILLTIPYGSTITYKEIGQKIAAQKGLPSMSAQAVGGAVGHNPISLIIPCHRVIASSGHLTGYAGGIDKKAKLLALENTSPTER